MRKLPDRVWRLPWQEDDEAAEEGMTHRLVFWLIAHDDAVLVWLNMLLLMFVAFLPFPTAAVGAHAGSPAAAVLYASAVCLTSAASAAWWYASGRGRLLRPDVARAQIRAMRARGLARTGDLRADGANCRVCPLCR